MENNYMFLVEKIGGSLGWVITIDNGYVYFLKKNAGRDYYFKTEKCNNVEDFSEEFWNSYENFDVSSEAYLRLDNSGHGTNGAPYEMIDVYNDMKDFQNKIKDLWSRLDKAFRKVDYVFLNEHTDIITDNTPVDLNDVGNADSAIEYMLPDNFSEKAKKFWEYLEGAAFIFEYEGRLVITDESLYLTPHGNGLDAPCGAPRWRFDSWKEFEAMLEMCYNEYAEGIEEILEPEEKYVFDSGVATFMNNEWKVVIALNKLTGFDLQEIYETINPDRINWNNFEVGDELWYADGSKSIKVKDRNGSAKTIWFGK